MYLHEQRERKEPREIKRIPYPTPARGIYGFMKGYLDGRELSFDLARQNGWYPTEYDGSPRIVIPCVNTGLFNYWQARSMLSNDLLRYKSPAVPRRDSVVHITGPDVNTIGITEGPMDALAIGEFFPCIAIMGGHPSHEVLDHIEKLTSGRRVVVIPDQDNTVLVELLRVEGLRFSVAMPTKKDIAEMPKWERKQLLSC